MKRKVFALLLTVLACYTAKLHCQNEFFSNPVALSDSVSDNTNAVIAWPFMFWERATGKSATEIYFRNLDVMDDPQPVFQDSGFHYRNPRALALYEEPLNCLFYESDKNGDWDIFYRTYDGQGNFSDEFSFFPAASNDVHLRITTDTYEATEGLVWESDGTIMFTTIGNDQGQPVFTPPVSFGEGGFSPEIGRGTYVPDFVVCWLEYNQQESAVLMMSKSIDYGITWDVPVELYTAQEISSIVFSNPFWEGYYISLCFETMDYGTWTPRLCTFEEQVFQLYELDLGVVQQESYSPVYFNYWPPVDPYLDDDIVSFTGYINGQADIMVYLDLWTGLINLTNTAQDERNPRFFIGEVHPDMTFEFWDIWESYVNNHWQIFGAWAWLGGTGVPESRAFIPGSLVVSPNPASGVVHLSFDLLSKEHVTIEIYDLAGTKILDAVAGSYSAGSNFIDLKLHECLNSQGTFILCLCTGNDMISTKIVYTGSKSGFTGLDQ